MALIGSIISFLIGAFFIFYALSIPAFMAGQYFILGFLFLAGGVALYIYRGRKKKSDSADEE
tara:strand:- start:128 stop:313 length:186 start_codon:yes stop_codon:yes gene_type:complete